MSTYLPTFRSTHPTLLPSMQTMSNAPPSNILDLYANLRSQLVLNGSPHTCTDSKQTFVPAVQVITGASTNFQTLVNLLKFLEGVAALDHDVGERLHSLPSNTWLDADEKLHSALLNLLSLDAEKLSSSQVWSAVKNRVSVATGKASQPEKRQQPQQAGDGSFTTSLTTTSLTTTSRTDRKSVV